MACLFDSIVDGRVKSEKVYEDDDVLAFLDIRPSAHALASPLVRLLVTFDNTTPIVSMDLDRSARQRAQLA